MITFVFLVRFSKELTRFKGFFSLGLIHFRIAIERVKSTKEITAQKAREQIKNRRYILDSTKRASLLPGNLEKIGKWEDLAPMPIKVKPVPQPEPPKPKIKGDQTKQNTRQPQSVLAPLKIEENFVHKFFGSQLSVGDRVIAQGLAKKLHVCEITGDQLLIDNIPMQVNQGELGHIKNTLRSTRA